MLEGKRSYLVQEIRQSDTDAEGESHQYIGVPFNYYTYTENGETVYATRAQYTAYTGGSWSGSPITMHTSLLQISTQNSVMQRVLSTASIAYTFRNVTVDMSGFIIAMDGTDDHTVLCAGIDDT